MSGDPTTTGLQAGPSCRAGWERALEANTADGAPSLRLVPQEWVTSTELLISLDRLNTFGDDIFKDPKVLQSYYYAVSDFSVGGR